MAEEYWYGKKNHHKVIRIKYPDRFNLAYFFVIQQEPYY